MRIQKTRERPNLVWASIDPIITDEVTMRLNNSSSQRVSFWIYGVLPPKVGFIVDGNTQWSTTVPIDPAAKVIEIRRDGLKGPTLIYVELDRQK